MRLFINKHYFISVIENGRNLNGDTIYSCQVMELIHGMGMYDASITDNQEDVISSIVHDTFDKYELKTTDLNEVFNFHKECLLKVLELQELTKADYYNGDESDKFLQ